MARTYFLVGRKGETIGRHNLAIEIRGREEIKANDPESCKIFMGYLQKNENIM